MEIFANPDMIDMHYTGLSLRSREESSIRGDRNLASIVSPRENSTSYPFPSGAYPGTSTSVLAIHLAPPEAALSAWFLRVYHRDSLPVTSSPWPQKFRHHVEWIRSRTENSKVCNTKRLLQWDSHQPTHAKPPYPFGIPFIRIVFAMIVCKIGPLQAQLSQGFGGTGILMSEKSIKSY
jgi:hypothetical protein